MRSIICPPNLRKGDTIGIVCPAGFMPAENTLTCRKTLEKWGFCVKMGATVGHQFHYFSGTDEERLTDMQQMLDDPNIKAILCGRGGYGCTRIIDQLNWKKFKKNPKWIIGFSDVTVFHNFLYTQLHTASIHGPMANAFNNGGATGPYVPLLLKALTGKAVNIKTPAHSGNKKGNAKGRLLGGNLSLLAHQIGTPSDIDTKGNILFIEDVGEYLYNVDRMMLQLDRAGKLKGLAGLIVGGFSEMKDTTTPFGSSLENILLERLSNYSFPVCFHFPVSHQVDNVALQVGMTYELSVGKTVTLKKCQ